LKSLDPDPRVRLLQDTRKMLRRNKCHARCSVAYYRSLHRSLTSFGVLTEEVFVVTRRDRSTCSAPGRNA
jgi:hypothetical protein